MGRAKKAARLTKTFGGKRYYFHGATSTKKAAQIKAAQFRKKSMFKNTRTLARVVKVNSAWGAMWAVYTRDVKI